ncbi:MAG: TusE/DsrC/DsvC family sulfur relay protein [Candidatus Sedimenticola sp. PURPLELP]
MPIPDPMATETSNVPESFHEWTEELASQLAAEEEIDLTPAHWDVIKFVRGHCEANGTSCSARLMLKAMTANFKREGGKRYLYTLFPRGPVVQACKIAGIPLPAYSLDLSFGSVH